MAGFAAGMQLHDRQMDRIMRMAMSPRQLELNRCWGFYYCEQYDARSTTWDGRPVMNDLEKENIARTQVLPPGFWDPSGKFDEIPLALRKPTAPYHLVRVVVNRFTGLLFSARKHPQVMIAQDQKLQSWVEGLIKAARLWIRWAYARTLGGAMGAVSVTFRFQNGRPVIEVHDPRWCTPTFVDRASGDLSALEIRYMYPQECYDDTGKIKQVWFWYRRVINTTSDVLFAPAPVGDGDEPQWVVATQVDHALGEFPGVWVRNSQTEDQDGEPDCHGEFETQEAIDRLLSQADQGAVENCDPTLLLQSDELQLANLKKGSRNAIKLESKGSGSYLEMSGAGVEAALKMVEVHRRNFLEVVQCILDSESASGNVTATEIERRYSSMHERGDLFREQYGELGVKPLIGKIIRAAYRVRSNGPVDQATGLRVVGVVSIPATTPSDGQVADLELPQIDGTKVTDDMIELTWPDWIQRGPSDAQLASGAVASARSAKALDQESALQFLAPFFGIDNPGEAFARLQNEDGTLDAQMMADLQRQQKPEPAPAATPAPADDTKKADSALTGPQITAALEIAMSVADGTVAPDAAIAMLVQFFQMPHGVAQQIVAAQLAKAHPVAPAVPGAPPGGAMPVLPPLPAEPALPPLPGQPPPHGQPPHQ